MTVLLSVIQQNDIQQYINQQNDTEQYFRHHNDAQQNRVHHNYNQYIYFMLYCLPFSRMPGIIRMKVVAPTLALVRILLAHTGIFTT
jgi:hypothetical protein